MPTADQNSYQPGIYREQGGNILRFKRTALMGVPECLLWGNAPVLQCLADISYGYLFQDDFLHPATSAVSDVLAWTKASDGATGTAVFQDTAGGVLQVATAAVQDDYHAYNHPYEMFNLAEGKKLWFEARFKCAEATTNDAAYWFGFTDTLTTGGFQTGASGPLADYDGAMIWKDEDSMALDFETSNATTQNTTTAMATVVTDTWTRVGFYFDGTATTSIITPYYEVTGVAGAPMIAGTAQNLTLASMTASELVFGIKAGPGGAAETLQMDYIRVLQLR
jgi:hypothetical protein